MQLRRRQVIGSILRQGKLSIYRHFVSGSNQSHSCFLGRNIPKDVMIADRAGVDCRASDDPSSAVYLVPMLMTPSAITHFKYDPDQ